MNPFALQYPAGRTPHEYAAAVGKRAWGRFASRKDWEASLYGHVKLDLPTPKPEPPTP